MSKAIASERCGECGGQLRVVDAKQLLRECVRCGTKQSAAPAPAKT